MVLRYFILRCLVQGCENDAVLLRENMDAATAVKSTDHELVKTSRYCTCCFNTTSGPANGTSVRLVSVTV